MILETKVTLFADCERTQPKSYPTLGQILNAIKNPSERTKTTIAEARAEPDKDKRSIIKKRLAAIVFHAELAHRRGGDDKPTQRLRWSGLLCLDFDGIDDVLEAREKLKADPHVISVFVSPSGDGLKAIVPVADPISEVWRTVANYFKDTCNLLADETRKDDHGLCFVSHDEMIYIAENPDACSVFKTDPKTIMPVFASSGGDVIPEYTNSAEASKPLAVINPDCDYARWIEIGQAIHCQFLGSAEGMFLWDDWSKRGQKYIGQKDIETHYRSFKSEGITFKTVLKYAIEAGWTKPGKPRKNIAAPVPVVSNDPLKKLIDAEIEGTYHLTPWPWPCLTEKSRSLLPGSVTILCGAPGSAKSWFVLSCLHFFGENNVDSHVLMLEENKAWHLKRLLAYLCGDPLYLDSDWCRSHPDVVNAALERHRDKIDTVSSRLHCEGNVTIAACADWVEKQCDAGVRVLIIDPITLADPGAEKTWDADRRFMARIKVAIEKSGTSLILVTHPKKMGAGKQGPPQMDDIAGGAAYGRAAASVLWLAGLENTVDVPVITADGQYTMESAHKVIKIIKARNGIGQNANIAFAFLRLKFKELGIVAKQKEKTVSTRGPKLKSQPSASEDLFPS